MQLVKSHHCALKQFKLLYCFYSLASFLKGSLKLWPSSCVHRWGYFFQSELRCLTGDAGEGIKEHVQFICLPKCRGEGLELCWINVLCETLICWRQNLCLYLQKTLLPWQWRLDRLSIAVSVTGVLQLCCMIGSSSLLSYCLFDFSRGGVIVRSQCLIAFIDFLSWLTCLSRFACLNTSLSVFLEEELSNSLTCLSSAFQRIVQLFWYESAFAQSINYLQLGSAFSQPSNVCVLFTLSALRCAEALEAALALFALQCPTSMSDVISIWCQPGMKDELKPRLAKGMRSWNFAAEQFCRSAGIKASWHIAMHHC